MKILLCVVAWLGATAVVYAQLLPVPNARNPDWMLDNTTLGSRSSQHNTLPGSRDRMPIADPNPQGSASAMPNALANSISGAGNRRYYWDAARQLSYEWSARPDQVTPDSLVTVRQQATGATFTYRRRPRRLQASPKELRIIRDPTK